MNSTYVQRLQEAMEAKRPPADRKALAEAMGITVQALGNVLRGEVRKINYTQASRAARFLEVDLEWLTGEEFKAQAQPHANASKFILVDTESALPLPPPPMRSPDYYAVGRMTILDYNRAMAQFRKAMPAQYRANCGVEVPTPSERKVYFDYYSNQVAAMVIPVQGVTVGKHPTDAVLEMAMSRQGYGFAQELVLIFIAADDRFPGRLTPAAEEACRMWGINKHVVATPGDAAEIISRLEAEVSRYTN